MISPFCFATSPQLSVWLSREFHPDMVMLQVAFEDIPRQLIEMLRTGHCPKTPCNNCCINKSTKSDDSYYCPIIKEPDTSQYLREWLFREYPEAAMEVLL